MQELFFKSACSHFLDTKKSEDLVEEFQVQFYRFNLGAG